MSIDYHVEVDNHFYSVPNDLVGDRVDARLSATTVEVLSHRRGRVAAHPRSRVRGGFTTNPEHMPKSHREHQEWSPTRLINWAKKVGPQTAGLVTVILESRPHPEHGYRSCLGIMRLAKKYDDDRVELRTLETVFVEIGLSDLSASNLTVAGGFAGNRQHPWGGNPFRRRSWAKPS